MEGADQAARGRDGCEEAAEKAWSATGAFLARAIYDTAYAVSYGVVFPAAVVRRRFPAIMRRSADSSTGPRRQAMMLDAVLGRSREAPAARWSIGSRAAVNRAVQAYATVSLPAAAIRRVRKGRQSSIAPRLTVFQVPSSLQANAEPWFVDQARPQKQGIILAVALDWISSILRIVLINAVLSGDNAMVIALAAASDCPRANRRKP